MPKHIRQQAGSEALHTATGRTHDEWHEVLVAAGASGWKHKQIAEHLVAEHGVDGWWAQGITVDFEQRVQGRQPGQRSDGTFESAVRRTIAGEQLAALELVAASVAERYGEPVARSMTLRTPTIRFKSGDTRVIVDAQQPKASGTSVGITVAKLPTAEALAEAKSWATGVLETCRHGRG